MSSNSKSRDEEAEKASTQDQPPPLSKPAATNNQAAKVPEYSFGLQGYSFSNNDNQSQKSAPLAQTPAINTAVSQVGQDSPLLAAYQYQPAFQPTATTAQSVKDIASTMEPAPSPAVPKGMPLNEWKL